VPANERTEGLLVSFSELGEDVLLGAFGREGPRPDHRATVARNAGPGPVSTVGMARSLQDDEDLLIACAEGDEQALGLLYDRFGSVAYRLALRVVRDAALAEDVVQETFLAVWRQADRFDRSRGRASTWIFTLAHRRAVDRVRREARFNALPDQLGAMAPQIESTGDDVALREARREVQAALSTLSSVERQAIELAYWGGLTQREIAAALGIPLGTVKSRMFTALARLRETLSREADGRLAGPMSGRT
jgi:RNA polymerase sigma-70 factor (ECF subfamily)